MVRGLGQEGIGQAGRETQEAISATRRKVAHERGFTIHQGDVHALVPVG